MNAQGGQQHTDLSGQVALVTGGGRGIGRTVAARLAAAGASVVLLARSGDELAETVASIGLAGGRAGAVTTDVSDRVDVQQAVAKIEREMGQIDLLVNNAAVATPVGPAWELDPDEWWRTIDVNLRGPFLCAHAVLPGMVARRSGRIVNIVAVAAYRASPFMSAYASSKAALVRLTETLAAETREHGISVFAVRPGQVQTRMLADLTASPWIRMPAGARAPEAAANRAAEAIVLLAGGVGDALSGRFIDVTTNDVADLANRAEEIVRNDLLALRLRT